MYQETASDLNKKFGESWCLFNKRVIYAHTFGYNNNDVLYVKVSIKKTTTAPSDPLSIRLFSGTVEIKPEDSIQPIPLEMGIFYNIPLSLQQGGSGYLTSEAWRLTRVPRRVTTQGFCYNTISLRPLIGSFIPAQLDRLPDCILNTALLDALYHGTPYVSYQEALKRLPRVRSCALSPRFAVCLNNENSSKHLLASVCGFVGECDENHIKVYHGGTLQEVRDFLQQYNLTNIQLIDATT